MNKVILSGRLARDPEIRYTQTGKCVAQFTLAVNRRTSKDAQQADFIPIVVWNKLAEICGQYLQKGSQIIVEGRIQVRQYTVNDNSKRYITEVIANEIEFTGKTKPYDDESNTKRQGLTPQAAKQQSFGKEVAPEDEEIPF